MSYHWENVTWQSKDGSWNRGYFGRLAPVLIGEDYDSEWDDEFDQSYFDYVLTGFKTELAALEWTPRGNPGYTETIPYKGNSKLCKHYDELAYFYKHPEARAKKERNELLRKNRAHFKQLEATWKSELQAARPLGYFTVGFKSDEAVYSTYGGHTSYSGKFELEGDWLLIAGKRVFNRKTGKFHARVRSLARVESRTRW